MKHLTFSRAQWISIVGAALTLWWIVAGTVGMTTYGILGYEIDTEGTTTWVSPSGPAETSGLRVGDHIVEIEGRDGDLDIGQAVTIVVERQGEPLRLEATAGSLPRAYRIERVVLGVLALGILVCGLVAFLVTESRPALLLLLYCICRAIHDSGQPSAPSAVTGEIILSFVLLAMMLASPLLLHFTLVFPRRWKFVQRRIFGILVYGPAVVALLLVITKLALPDTHPRAGGLESFFYTFVLAVALLYQLPAIAVVVIRFVRASRESRRADRLDVMLWGMVAAIAPYFMALFVESLLPSISIPGDGSHSYTAFFILLPLAFSYAVIADHRPGL